MPDDDVRISSERPPDLDEWAVLRFFPEHGTAHPLWVKGDVAHVDALGLPAALIARIERWSGYWNRECHWDGSWSDGRPDDWWLDEERALPIEVARAFGSAFVVHDLHRSRYVRSIAPPSIPAVAESMRAYVEREIEHERMIADMVAGGARFTISADARAPTDAPA